MNLPMNAAITCTDELYGTSTAIILDPTSNEVTHLIVREPGFLGIDRMVPIDLVRESTPGLIRLSCTKDELTKMASFVSTGGLPTSPTALPGYTGMIFSPYLSMQPEISIDELPSRP